MYRLLVFCIYIMFNDAMTYYKKPYRFVVHKKNLIRSDFMKITSNKNVNPDEYVKVCQELNSLGVAAGLGSNNMIIYNNIINAYDFLTKDEFNALTRDNFIYR